MKNVLESNKMPTHYLTAKHMQLKLKNFSFFLLGMKPLTVLKVQSEMINAH